MLLKRWNKHGLAQSRCWTALVFLTSLGTAHAADYDQYTPPTSTQLKTWGLEYIHPFSTPLADNLEAPAKRSFLPLGPKKGSKRQCVTVVRITNQEQACKSHRCQGLFEWWKSAPPLDGQHALLSQSCNAAIRGESTLLYAYYGADADKEMRFNPHVQVLSAVQLSKNKSTVAAGPWAQGESRNQYTIELFAQVGSAVLHWSPKKGFALREEKP